MKVELSTRVYAATGTAVDPTLKIEGTGDATHAIVILAKLELHITLGPLFMATAKENSTQTCLRGYTPYSVGHNQEYNL